MTRPAPFSVAFAHNPPIGLLTSVTLGGQPHTGWDGIAASADADGTQNPLTRARIMSVDLVLSLHEQCKGLLAKSDGKDKTIALLQYAAMFASGGEPGTALAIQKSLGAARKPFRLYKPVEILVPFLRSPPDFAANGVNAAVEYAKNIGMALYFGCDHVVWAHGAGVVKDAAFAKNMQKISLWGWFIASCAGLYAQTGELTAALDEMTDANKEESDASRAKDGTAVATASARKRDAARVARGVMAGVVTSGAQALLALALLEQIPMSKRKTGALGVFLSAMNVYRMAPPLKKKTA